ncbi:eukaryotic translation initiation factor 2C 2, partial [Trichinella spiralis]|uniref:eukaryotic translation initiation factor 2C 2 n=1 Tax=Trichinella spiralis TaxID=6334 RepID=UPI0001EFD7EF
MYLQVELRVEDCDACRFLWRNCLQDAPVRAYRFICMCFGLACFPYLAANVIKAHTKRNPKECDEVIKQALSNMYVDDLVMSCDEESEVAESICRVLIQQIPFDLEYSTFGYHRKKQLQLE